MYSSAESLIHPQPYGPIEFLQLHYFFSTSNIMTVHNEASLAPGHVTGAFLEDFTCNINHFHPFTVAEFSENF